jgi:hypothetical protein
MMHRGEGSEYEAKWTKVSEELKLTEEERVFLMSRLRGVHTPSVPLIFADLPLDAGLVAGLAILGIDFYKVMDGGCVLKDAPLDADGTVGTGRMFHGPTGTGGMFQSDSFQYKYDYTAQHNPSAPEYTVDNGDDGLPYQRYMEEVD